MRTPLWPLGKAFRWFYRVCGSVHPPLSVRPAYWLLKVTPQNLYVLMPRALLLGEDLLTESSCKTASSPRRCSRQASPKKEAWTPQLIL